MNEFPGQTSEKTIDEVAEQFVEELRSGKHPSIIRYKEEYPQLAEEIDELFPMLCELEVHQDATTATIRPLDPGAIPEKLGEYVIVREIGRGGMGVVYEAKHDIMDRRVALKVLPRSFCERKHFLERFMREARSAGKLHHTNIVPIFEVGQADGIYFYAMQYIHGENLDVVIDELRRLSKKDKRNTPALEEHTKMSVAMTMWNGSTKMVSEADTGVDSGKIAPAIARENEPVRLPNQKQAGESSEWYQVGDSGDSYFRRAARVGIQIAEALDFAHEHGLLHRDIKPSNLILDTNGVVWITDFGLAKVDGDNLTHTGDIVGTLRYMAPERFAGKADRRSDLYSLGLTLYELCTLEYAFDGSDRAALVNQVMNQSPVSLRRIRPEIPRDLETVIVKAMARDPGSRYDSAGQMAADLRRFVAGKPVQARRSSIPERIWRWSKRHPARAALALSLLLLAATIVFGSVYFGYKERQHAQTLRVENDRARKAEREAREAENTAREAERAAIESEKKMVTARRGSNAHLFWANYRLGESLRTTGTPGQRFDSLESLTKAYQALPELTDIGLSEGAKSRRELAVRAHAIAALATWDLKEDKAFPPKEGWTPMFATDFVGNRYAYAALNGDIAIRDLDSNKQIALLQASDTQAWVTRFSPDGKYFAAKHHPEFRNHELKLVLWNLERTEKLLELTENVRSAHFAFSSDSSKIVVGEKTGLAVYATSDASLIKRINLGIEPKLVQFANQNSHLLFVSEPENVVQFWSIEQAKLATEVEASFEIDSLDWNEDLKQLAVGGNRLLAVWPPGELNAEPFETIAHGSSIRHIKLRPQGDLLISCGWDNTTRVLDLVSRKQVLQVNGHQLTFSGFSDDGRLAFVATDGKYGVWRFTDFRSLQILARGAIEGTQQVHFHPLDSRIAGCMSEQGIEFWNHIINQRIGIIECDEVTEWAFGDDGKNVYVLNSEGVQRWSLAIQTDGQPGIETTNPELITNLPAKNLHIDELQRVMVVRNGDHAKIVSLDGDEVVSIGPHKRMASVQLSPCSRFVVSTTWKGHGLKIWDARTGDLLRDLVPEWETTKFAFSPDGKKLAAVSKMERWVWDVETWEATVMEKRDVADGTVGALTWSRDGKFVASQYNLNQPQLFLAETGRTVAVFEPTMPLGVGQLEFSDDNHYLAVASRNGIHIWDIQGTQKKLTELGMGW